MADLFSGVINELKPTVNADNEVVRLCEFVKNLTPGQLSQIKASREQLDFDEWQQAARGLQAFAFERSLNDDWWRIVAIVTEARKGLEWNAGWDAAYDLAVATLLRPYFGVGLPKPWEKRLTGALIAVGWDPAAK